MTSKNLDFVNSHRDWSRCEDLLRTLSKNIDHVFGLGAELDRAINVVTKVVDSSYLKFRNIAKQLRHLPQGVGAEDGLVFDPGLSGGSVDVEAHSDRFATFFEVAIRDPHTR